MATAEDTSKRPVKIISTTNRRVTLKESARESYGKQAPEALLRVQASEVSGATSNATLLNQAAKRGPEALEKN
jgi:hypothetical protein